MKEDCIDARSIPQGLAQTIVNAFCETQKGHTQNKTFIPSFIASCKHIKITMYSCDLDRLLISPDLRLFVKLDVNQNIILDFSTVLSVWFALNFDIYISATRSFLRN